MAKRGKRKTARAESPPPPRDRVGVLLLAIAAALGALAIFQWYELITVQEGGSAVCAISDKLDCEVVWNSAFAKSIHRATKLPLAAWGVVYSLTALAAAYRFHRLNRAGKRESEPVWAVRFVAAVGAVSSLILLIATFGIGTFCITCLLTYGLVAGYTVVAFKMPSIRPLSQTKPGRIVVVPFVYAMLGWIVLLWPGSATPIEPKTHLPPQKKPEPTTAKSDLELYLERLPTQVQQNVSDSLENMRRSPKVTARRTPRRVHGEPNAPIRFLDFSDIRCTHCRQLDQVMQELERTVPPGSYSLESRFFPLDTKCNRNVPGNITDDTGVRCLGPKVLICLEQKPGYEPARHRMFEEQQSLTLDKVWEIAVTEGGVPRAELEKCVADPATTAKVDEDIAYAMEYHLDGTPLVLVNGKTGSSVPSFLYAIILAGGDPNHPAFAHLPPPKPDAHVH
jgi:hypothetical protein